MCGDHHDIDKARASFPAEVGVWRADFSPTLATRYGSSTRRQLWFHPARSLGKAFSSEATAGLLDNKQAFDSLAALLFMLVSASVQHNASVSGTLDAQRLDVTFSMTL
jgi:hypothetical protein